MPSKKWFATDLPIKILRKDFVGKNENEFPKSSFQSAVLKKGFLKTKFDCENFTFQNEKRFRIIFKKTSLVCFIQKVSNALFQN